MYNPEMDVLIVDDAATIGRIVKGLLHELGFRNMREAENGSTAIDAIVFNRRHRRWGHLFQNRYKSILCEEDPYFLELVRYIHLNPLRGKLIDSAGALDNYPHSGHSALMGNRPTSGRIPLPF